MTPSPRLSPSRSRSAFTITEVMVAAAVLVIIAGVTLSCLAYINAAAATGRMMVAARRIVNERISSALNEPYIAGNVDTTPRAFLNRSSENLSASPPVKGTLICPKGSTSGTITEQVPIYEPRPGLNGGTGGIAQGQLTTEVRRDTTFTDAFFIRVRIQYVYARRTFTYEMSSFRAPD
jgi:hypothetical protein